MAQAVAHHLDDGRRDLLGHELLQDQAENHPAEHEPPVPSARPSGGFSEDIELGFYEQLLLLGESVRPLHQLLDLSQLLKDLRLLAGVNGVFSRSS